MLKHIVTANELNLFYQLYYNLPKPFSLPQISESGFDLQNHYLIYESKKATSKAIPELIPEWLMLNQALKSLVGKVGHTFKDLMASLPDQTSIVSKQALNYLNSLPKQKLVFRLNLTKPNDLTFQGQNVIINGWQKLTWQLELNNMAELIITESQQECVSITEVTNNYLSLLTQNNYQPDNRGSSKELIKTALVYNLLCARQTDQNQVNLKEVLT